ncbi:MAG: PSD1 and planctomycete cytochrome C domain-containing protein [Phycisphaerales bacterium]|nr:PSD1 and planctomycete cytochrome C domain-containing protein [Phycisphaerales bacterium]
MFNDIMWSLSISILAASVSSAAGSPVGPVSFDRQIRPLLAAKCILCHGNAEESRQADLRLHTQSGLMGQLRGGGAVVVPGDPGSSGLFQRITSTDPAYRMPPSDEGHAALSPDEIDLVRRWIEQGAPWEEHWAWVPPVAAERADAAAHPVDAFINAKLNANRLQHSPPSDRANLLRRASLDLIGLPPTPEAIAAFEADTAPGAWNRQVDQLLASPHFGERWARVWLDHARYADTKGYEKDYDRTIWPWRDWVIDAINDDMPFDQFTIEQIAGDLLPNATDDQVLATAFHRNTMNNDEGGTDDEEFRVAAVVDRTNTTMQAWMGVTISCAQCHDHPSDPFTQREYYGLFAMLNQTQDADRPDEQPVLPVLSHGDRASLADVRGKRDQALRLLDQHLANLDPEQPVPASQADHGRDQYWIDDMTPVGASLNLSNGEDWPWHDGDDAIPAFSGTRFHAGTATGPTAVRQQYFESAWLPLVLEDGDRLVAHAWLDPDNPPAQIMLQFHRPGDWEHRIFWGGDHNPWGQLGTTSRHRAGDLPPLGEWVRLEFDPAIVGLAPGDAIDGWAFTQAGGRVAWDGAGVVRDAPIDQGPLHSLQAFEAMQRTLAQPVIPADMLAVIQVPAADRSEQDQGRLEQWYLRHVQADARDELADERAAISQLDDEITAIRGRAASVPVMRAMDPGMARTTHILNRGSFLDPGEEVEPHVPALLHPLPEERTADRLALARWLVSRDNPLTARVHVNRTWERLFGRGLVETSEDFGTQGDRPSHPELLDWLAVTFMDRGWSHKELCRLIVTSEAYRRSSIPTGEARSVDPENRLLSHSPRVRLEAEAVRDQALLVSGLLDTTMHGPPVYPDQPAGLWQVTYDNRDWPQGSDRQRHRRGLYTFWRRSSPYPSMTTFDAPSREICSVRRIRTNTPLQALVTLNDPVYVEAAKALAGRMIREGGDELERQITRGFQLVLGRPPSAEETGRLMMLAEEATQRYAADPEQAGALLAQWPGEPPSGADPAHVAALVVVANVLLNLDETLTRG